MSDHTQWEQGYKHGMVIVYRNCNRTTGQNFRISEDSIVDVAKTCVDFGLSNIEFDILDNCSSWFRAGIRCFLDDFQKAVDGVKSRDTAQVAESITITF